MTDLCLTFGSLSNLEGCKVHFYLSPHKHNSNISGTFYLSLTFLNVHVFAPSSLMSGLYLWDFPGICSLLHYPFISSYAILILLRSTSFHSPTASWSMAVFPFALVHPHCTVMAQWVFIQALSSVDMHISTNNAFWYSCDCIQSREEVGKNWLFCNIDSIRFCNSLLIQLFRLISPKFCSYFINHCAFVLGICLKLVCCGLLI